MEAVAKFIFTASQGDELSFDKGSVLNVSQRRFCKPLKGRSYFPLIWGSGFETERIHFQVLDKDEDKNWYKAEQGDREGWIPNTYISMRPHR